MYKDFNMVPPSYYWFPCEYINSGVNKKLDKTKGQLTGDEMGKETKHYMESINHNLNQLRL